MLNADLYGMTSTSGHRDLPEEDGVREHRCKLRKLQNNDQVVARCGFARLSPLDLIRLI